jgi:hypothetical protein
MPLFGPKDRPPAKTVLNKPEAAAPPPLGRLESVVATAPNAVGDLQRAKEQRRKEALAQMDYMEAARKEKGNFCVTIGTPGDPKRAVLLVAPREGIQVPVQAGDRPDPAQDFTGTRTDYIMLTAQGPLRLSFNTQSKHDSVVKYDTERLKALKLNIEQAIKSKNPVIANSSFDAYEVASGTKVENHFRFQTSRGEQIDTAADYDPGHDRPDNHIDAVRDEAVVAQAVQASLQMVQAPIQDQLAGVRNQIKAQAAITKALQ